MVRTVAVLGASNTGKSTLVDRMCGLEGQARPAAAVLATPFLHAVATAGPPAVIFVNRIDEATGRVRDIVAALQDYAVHPIVLRQIPIRDGETVVGSSIRLTKITAGVPAVSTACR